MGTILVVAVVVVCVVIMGSIVVVVVVVVAKKIVDEVMKVYLDNVTVQCHCPAIVYVHCIKPMIRRETY